MKRIISLRDYVYSLDVPNHALAYQYWLLNLGLYSELYRGF